MDVITVVQAVHYFDLPAFFKEVRRWKSTHFTHGKRGGVSCQFLQFRSVNFDQLRKFIICQFYVVGRHNSSSTILSAKARELGQTAPIAR